MGSIREGRDALRAWVAAPVAVAYVLRRRVRMRFAVMMMAIVCFALLLRLGVYLLRDFR